MRCFSRFKYLFPAPFCFQLHAAFLSVFSGISFPDLETYVSLNVLVFCFVFWSVFWRYSLFLSSPFCVEVFILKDSRLNFSLWLMKEPFKNSFFFSCTHSIAADSAINTFLSYLSNSSRNQFPSFFSTSFNFLRMTPLPDIN